MKQPDNLVQKIALTLLPRVGSITARALVQTLGSVEAVFEADAKALAEVPGIGIDTASNIVLERPIALDRAAKELEFIKKYNVRTFFFQDKDYPQRLRNYDDAPIMLFMKGDADLNHPRIVGIVGTRTPTDYGRMMCEQLVEGLKEYGVLILSGLAYGIDITAHKASMEQGLPTVAAMGHGLKTIYPKLHASAAKEMVAKGGGLLTEFLSEAGPEAAHFPMRNRIIAGLCDALIVVETAISGGSVISAEFANEYQKDVFAVPGRLKEPMSAGCNHLIKTHKASLIESASDIGYILRWDKDVSPAAQMQLFLELSPEEEIIVEKLRGQESMGIEPLIIATGMSTSVLSAHLLELEFKGVLKSLAGKRYMLIR